MPTITLPLPPSVNQPSGSRRRVYRSPQYEAWRIEAGWALKLQGPARIPGAVQIGIAAGRPDRRRRDLDDIATKKARTEDFAKLIK